MSQQKTNPELPEIPALSKEQLHRLLAADYLTTLANMIRKGQITSFSLLWDQTLEKPTGEVAVDSSVILSGLEVRIMRDMAEMQREAEEKAARQIPYTDLTAETAEHGKCDNELCIACNNPNKA